jgi:hypothetical protein
MASVPAQAHSSSCDPARGYSSGHATVKPGPVGNPAGGPEEYAVRITRLLGGRAIRQRNPRRCGYRAKPRDAHQTDMPGRFPTGKKCAMRPQNCSRHLGSRACADSGVISAPYDLPRAARRIPCRVCLVGSRPGPGARTSRPGLTARSAVHGSADGGSGKRKAIYVRRKRQTTVGAAREPFVVPLFINYSSIHPLTHKKS